MFLSQNQGTVLGFPESLIWEHCRINRFSQREKGYVVYPHSDLNDALSLVQVISKENYGKMLPINYQRYVLYLNIVYIFTFLFYT